MTLSTGGHAVGEGRALGRGIAGRIGAEGRGG